MDKRCPPLHHIHLDGKSYRKIPQFECSCFLNPINPLHRILVLTCAATALRASEILALRWDDIEWEESRIRVCKRWSMGKDGATKNEASDGYVPLHSALAEHLAAWRLQTAFGRNKDFMFRPFGQMAGSCVAGDIRR